MGNLPVELKRQLLQEFLFGTDLNRRYTNELEQAESRLHLVEGLLTALSELDEVISLAAGDGSTAKITQSRFNLSEEQSDAILAMPLGDALQVWNGRTCSGRTN